MNFKELALRLKKGENIHTEFKESLIRSDDLAASIVAFANTDGGQIIIGVDNQGQIAGVGDPDRVMQFVDNVAYNNCVPAVTVVQETVRDESGRVVVIINIPKGDQRPYHTRRGVYYVRTTSGRRQASRQELLRLFQAVESIYYDETPIIRSTIANLEGQAIGDLLQTAAIQGIDLTDISKDRLLLNWSLARIVNSEKRDAISETKNQKPKVWGYTNQNVKFIFEIK